MNDLQTDLGLLVRDATVADAAAIASIYAPYVAETVITFEEEPVTADEIAARIEECRDAGLRWVVAERDGVLAGYAYASKWKGRCAYRFAAEVTVYVARGAGGGGIGSALYERLFADLKAAGLHTLLAGIALPNEASVAIHERFGFHQVAEFEEVGFKLGRWVNVGYWQKTFAGSPAA